MALYFILFSVLFTICVHGQPDWSSVTAVLDDEISRHTMPGCVAAVYNKNGFLYTSTRGNFTYGAVPPRNANNPPMTMNTMFDMASLTKVLVTTTCIMTFYQRGELDLDTRVSSPSLLGPAFAQNGKSDITVRHLLLHNSGFPPDPNPGYSTKPFGCPETSKQYPAEVFTCQTQIYLGLMQQKLSNPVGSTCVYSDLNMITGMYVVGHLAKMLGKVSPTELRPECAAGLHPDSPAITQCYYEVYANKTVIQKVNMRSSGFLPHPYYWPNIAPTWYDNTYRHTQLQGPVSDENAYALGGIAGHAGFFSTILDVYALTSRLAWTTNDDPWINKTTFTYFTTIYNRTQSSRALGWDTNDYVMNTYRGCANFSQSTWTHTGYTGTQVCGDPEYDIVAVLLTNRCYPDSTKTLPDIQRARQRFSNAVKNVLDNANILTKKK